MKYIDLSNIVFDPYDIENNIKLVENLGVQAPRSVIEQFYIDHNRDSTFQELYGDLDLSLLEWELIEAPTELFFQIGHNASYADFLEEMSEDASHYESNGDSVIDCRPEVLSHWKEFGSWLTPPILIDGNVIGKRAKTPHLVEGHSRVGCLLGINKYKIIHSASIHKIYWGTLRKST